MKSAADVVVAWTPTTEYRRGRDNPGSLAVLPKPPGALVDRYAHWQPIGQPGEDSEILKLHLFILFNTMVVRDGIDPLTAHQSLLTIQEFADGVSPEVGGTR